MKKITTLIIGLSLVCLTNAQEKKEKETTQAEQFSTQAGTLIEKQFVDIGKVKGVSIQVMKIKDLNGGSSKTALRFEMDYKSTYTTDTKIAVLDVDEIDGLIKSMTNLNTNVFASTRDTYTEVTFRSRTGFEAGAYYDVDKKKWVAYVKLDKYDSNSEVFLSTENFASILTFVEQAKAKM